MFANNDRDSNHGYYESEHEIGEGCINSKNIFINDLNLEQIFNYTHPMCIIDKNFNIVRINSTFTSIFHTTIDDIENKKCYNIIQSHLCNTPNCIMNKILEGENRREFEFNKEISNGIKSSFIITAYPFRNSDGEVIGVIESLTDITDRKKKEDLIRESEEKYRLITESANDIIIVIDQSFICKYVNEKVLKKICGYTEDEIVNKSIKEFIHPDDFMARNGKLKEIFNKGEAKILLRFQKKNLGYNWFEIKAKTFLDTKNKKKALLIARDVAEREKKKQQIKRAYFELNQIMNITIPMCVIDTNHNIIRINNTFASMLESESKELAGKKCYDVVPGPFCNTPKCTVTQILNGEEQWNYEKVLKLRNGSEVICNMKAVPYRDLNGKICGVIQNYVDITDRKKAEKLIKNIAKFPSENPNPVFRTNNEKILYANKIAQQILGISNNDSIPVDFQEYVKKSLKNDNIIKLELELNNHIYSFVIRSFKKLGYSNVYGRDITDQKNAETTLQTRNEEISALLNASKVVLKNSKFKETSKLIFKSYASLIKISEGFIGLLSPDKKFIKFHLLYLNGAIKELETPPSHPIGCFLSEVVKTKKVEFFNEGLNIEWKMFLPGTHFKLKNVILIPLIINDEVKGLVGLINKHTQFIETDVNLANAFAEIVSIAYRNSQILESLEESNKTYQSLSNELEQRVEDRTRKLKKSEERLRNLINNLSDVVIEHDIDGKITFLSPQIFSIIGFHPSELIGRLFLDLIHPDDRDIYKNVIVKINNPGDIFTQELGIKHKKGYYLPISIKGSLVYTNNQNRIIAVISDITEQKLIDDMLKKEIKKLKELEQIRGDLVRRISHELKTPLISIFSGSEYLLSHFENIENNEFKNMLKFIYKGGYRLKSLVNNLITAYDIESNEILLSIKQENVTPIIQDCIEDLIHQANKRKIFINTSLPRELFINIDKSRISHAISNVLSNAIKNTPLNGNIFIKVHTHTNYADIIVKDDGIGLTAKEITFLFKKFGKIERYGKGMDVDIEGAGLGLYISNEIVKLHKGEIIIKSRGRNKGCKVIIRLKR